MGNTVFCFCFLFVHFKQVITKTQYRLRGTKMQRITLIQTHIRKQQQKTEMECYNLSLNCHVIWVYIFFPIFFLLYCCLSEFLCTQGLNQETPNEVFNFPIVFVYSFWFLQFSDNIQILHVDDDDDVRM